MSKLLLIVVCGLMLSGCIHTVSFDDNAKAIWTAKPHVNDVR